MEYNTARCDMEYREYGRTIKKIVESVCSYPDGEQKDEATRAIVYSMALVANVSVKDDIAYHKLWDHLMVLSSFRLDHAWPFSEEELQELKKRVLTDEQMPAERLAYKNDQISSRYFGANLEKMLKKLKNFPDGEEYENLVNLVAQQTKRDFLVWNGELADDNIIVDNMERLSGDPRVGKLLRDKEIIVPQNTLPVDTTTNRKKKRKK